MLKAVKRKGFSEHARPTANRKDIVDEALTQDEYTVLSEQLTANQDDIEVPDIRIDLRAPEYSYSGISESPIGCGLSYSKRKKLGSSADYEETEPEGADSDYAADYSDCNLDSVSLERSFDLLSQSSDLESMTLEAFLDAGNVSVTSNREMLLQHADINNNASDFISLEVNEVEGKEEFVGSSSISSLTTEYGEYLSADSVTEMRCLVSSSNISITNPLLQSVSITPASTQITHSGVTSDELLERTLESLESVSFYTSDASLPSVHAHSARSSHSDQTVPLSSEDEMAVFLEQYGHRRRVLNSCGAQEVPDVLFIEE